MIIIYHRAITFKKNYFPSQPTSHILIEATTSFLVAELFQIYKTILPFFLSPNFLIYVHSKGQLGPLFIFLADPHFGILFCVCHSFHPSLLSFSVSCTLEIDEHQIWRPPDLWDLSRTDHPDRRRLSQSVIIVPPPVPELSAAVTFEMSPCWNEGEGHRGWQLWSQY